ncbi:hypothetical protein ACHAW6_003368 [Cyclotella cf. meneghiniana]
MNYFDTYVPVVMWFTIRIIIVMVILFTLLFHQHDFVQAYPQAQIETDMYMGSKGIETCHGSSKDHVLISYQKYVFFRDDIIFIVHVNDGIFLGPNNRKLTNIIREISEAGLDIKDQGH